VPVDQTAHILGSQEARITVVEYGDFECPFCKQAAPAVKLMLKRFGERVRFVFRHFPMAEVHPHAELAAEAAEAAGAQSQFWPMHDLLFDRSPHLKDKQLRACAAELELDLERYDYEMGDHVYLQRVRGHIDGGKRSGVRGTPAFFINGRIADATFGIDHLRQTIEKMK
jgi:protein-disulfide isomerase